MPKQDMKYGKLSVRTIDTATGTITLVNKDNAITLSKNRNIEILPGIFIRTADNDTLRYYIYKNITQPGTYEIRGSVAGTSMDEQSPITWNPQNFAGFYYDIKKDLGTETLTTTLTVTQSQWRSALRRYLPDLLLRLKTTSTGGWEATRYWLPG